MYLKAGDVVSVVCVVASDSSLDDSSVSVSVNGTRAYPLRKDVSVIRHFVPSGHPCQLEGRNGNFKVMHTINDLTWVEDVETGEHQVVESKLIRRPDSKVAA